MKLAKGRHYRAVTAAAATVALVSGALVAAAGSADATTPPPWVTTEQTEHEEAGTVSLYNSSGVQITSGALNGPLAAFAVASGGLPGASVAASGVTVYMASPAVGEPANFFEDTLSSAAAVPYLGTLPPSLSSMQSAGHLVVPVQLGYNDYAADGNKSTYPSWTTTYEVRILGSDTSKWYAADIQVDTVANTWTQIYPAPVVATVPDAPTAVIAVPGASSASVKWTAPVNNGGAPITGYHVQYSSDGGTTWHDGPASALTSTLNTATVTGLTNGTSYVFWVAAINSVGTGAWSATSAAVVPRDLSTLTIVAPKTEKYGVTASITGKLTDKTTALPIASASVKLYKRLKSGVAWTLAGTVTSSSTGAITKAIKFTSNDQWYWTYAATDVHGAVSSAIATTSVTQGVTIAAKPTSVRHGGYVKIYGTVSPAGTGAKVTLQKLVGTKWVTVTTAVLKSQKLPSGVTAVGYVFTVKLATVGTFRYHVTKAATTTLAAGTSATLAVKGT